METSDMKEAMSTAPWGKYRIERDVTPPGGRIDLQTMDELYHVAHFAHARRILEDRQLTAGLIHDESVLNKTRLCVVWTSPNTWVDGSLYGNIRLSLPVSEMLQHQQLYWIEAIETVKPVALRILVTNQDFTKRFKRLDPSKYDQPLHRTSDGQMYRLDRYNYEIMLARDVLLSSCTEVEAVKHHARICSDTKACSDKGVSDLDASRRWAAIVLGNGDAETAPLMARSRSMHSGLIYLKRRFHKLCKGVVTDPATIKALITAASAAFGRKEEALSKTLLRAIHPDAPFDECFSAVVQEMFGSDYDVDDDDEYDQ